MTEKTYITKCSPGDEVCFLHDFTICTGKIILVRILDSENDFTIPYLKIEYQIEFQIGENADFIFRNETEVFPSREELIMSIK